MPTTQYVFIASMKKKPVKCDQKGQYVSFYGNIRSVAYKSCLSSTICRTVFSNQCPPEAIPNHTIRRQCGCQNNRPTANGRRIRNGNNAVCSNHNGGNVSCGHWGNIACDTLIGRQRAVCHCGFRHSKFCRRCHFQPLCYAGSDGVILVHRKNSAGNKNANNRHHNHQFDQCKSFLFHDGSLNQSTITLNMTHI